MFDAAASARTEREEFFFELREILSLMARRGRWIAACGALCACVAAATAALREPAYISTAQVMLDPRGLNVVSDQVVPQPPSADVNDAVIDTEMRLLSSDTVLRAAVVRCGLQDDPTFVGRPGLLARAEAALGLRGALPRPADPVGVAAGVLRQRLTVQRDGKSFVVNITAKADAPAMAARIAKAAADSFLAALVTQKRELVTQAQGAMGATLDGQRDRLARAENAVEEYKKKAGIVDADGRTLNIASVTQLDSQILTARSATAALAARLAQLDAARRRPSQAADVDSALLTQLRASRTDVARQQANLRTTLGPRHPQIQEIDAQLKSIDRAVAAEVERLTATARADYGSAAKREQSLLADRARLEGKVADVNTSLVEMRQLEREADAQRGVYQKFLGRERDLREQETVSSVNAALITEPAMLETPVGVKPWLLVVAGALLGVLLGSALAWAYERWTGRVYTAERLGARTGLPVLGTVSAVLPARGGPLAIGCALTTGRGTATSRLIQRLADALDQGRGPSSLLVLPASDGDAASLVASGVVLAAAAQGHNALLVKAAQGEDAVLSGLGLLPGSVTACEVEGFPAFDVERLAHRPSPATLDWLGSSWTSQHDCVVIDIGPDADDATIHGLAAGASAVVMVIEAGISTFSEVDALRDLVDGNADLSLLFAVRGSDAVRVLPAKAVPLPSRAGPPRAVRASRV